MQSSQNKSILITRNLEYDLITIKLDLNKENTILIIPFDLLYISDITNNHNLIIHKNVSSFHYLIVESKASIADVEINIKCKLKSHNSNFISPNQINNSKNKFNFLPINNTNQSYYKPLELNILDPKNCYPYILSFLINSKSQLKELQNIISKFNPLKSIIYDITSGLKYEIRNKTDYDETQSNFEEINSFSTDLDFEDNYPFIDIFINFTEKKIITLPNRIIFNYDDFHSNKLSNQVNYLSSLTQIPDTNSVSLFLENEDFEIINFLNNSTLLYIPIFRETEDVNKLFLKKKYSPRLKKKDGKLTFDFQIYSFNYEIKKNAEELFQNEMKAIFKNDSILTPSLSLISFGLEYFKNGRLKNIKLKKSDNLPKSTIEKIESLIINTQLINNEQDFYLIFFFETYFE